MNIDDPNGQVMGKAPQPAGVLTGKVLHFCDLIMSGASNAHAFRTAYGKPKMDVYNASEQAYRVMHRPIVAWHLAELRGASKAKTILSINERLAILAGIAQNKAAAYSDQIRAISEYNKTAGDQAPQRMELTGPGGTALRVNTTVSTMGRITVAERIRLLGLGMQTP